MNRIATIAAALISVAASFGAQAQSTTTPASTYDYASKFYPHPAWLYLRAEAPREMGQHPAVLVAQREKARQQEDVAVAAQKFYPHPAWLYLASEAPIENTTLAAR